MIVIDNIILLPVNLWEISRGRAKIQMIFRPVLKMNKCDLALHRFWPRIVGKEELWGMGEEHREKREEYIEGNT